ncbi:MAG: chromosomal replication initiator protein DnaA [Ruminococcaceae bacterium]|nr:chromosomal replication initiator protein DnaA [Oscillospiraceae bacterium]
MDNQNAADLSVIWQMTEERMRETYKYTEQSFNLWFGRMQLRFLDAERAVFVCENEFKRGVIEKQYLDFVEDCLTDVLGYSPEVSIGVDKSLAPEVPDDGTTVSPLKMYREKQAQQAAEEAKKSQSKDWSQPKAPNISNIKTADDISDIYSGGIISDDDDDESPVNDTRDSRGDRRLTYNEDYTFDNFIVGDSNRFAHAAARNVADNIGMKINPLFIWGPPGLGKTHLMYAIANQALARNPDMKVIYVKGEEFLNQLVEAIQKGKNQQFRQKYRSADMLLIDDIQFIAGKEATQTEFFHTFDALYEDKKQIIITSDRPPKELISLEERIRSRFEAGLLADIKPPDYELRLAILRKKISQNNIDVPTDVVDFLAKNLQENIRQLEGVIKKLSMANLLTGHPVNMEMVIQTVPEYLRDSEPVTDTITRIVASTARHFNVSGMEILGTSRKKEIKTARNVAMYVTREVTQISFPQIGAVFNRDHSTVHSNIGMIESEMQSDPVLEATVGEILKEIKRS